MSVHPDMKNGFLRARGSGGGRWFFSGWKSQPLKDSQRDLGKFVPVADLK